MMLCAPLTVFAQKFGHVDAQAVMQSLPEFIKARGEIEALSKQYENDMKAMQDEIQRKSDEYDKSKSTMNATQQQEVETNLQQMIQKFQQAYQDNQQALQKAQQEKMQPIMNKIMTAIKNVETSATADGAYYTLQGVKVEKPTKGIYVHNGKKVIIK